MSKVSESGETLIGHKRSHKDKKKHHKKHKKHHSHRKQSLDEQNPESPVKRKKVEPEVEVDVATPVNEMTSSSSSGCPATQTQELKNLSKASPRKVACPPYRGIGFDFSHYTRIMLSEMGELPATTQLSLFTKKPLLSIGKIKGRD